MKSFFDMVHSHPKKLALFGAACNAVTDPIAKASQFFELIQLSYADTHPMYSDENYPNFFRVVPSEAAFNPAMVSLLKHFNWTRVGSLYQTDPRHSLPQNSLHTELDKEKITIVQIEGIGEGDDITDELNKLREIDVRIILGNFDEEWARKVFCSAYRAKMFGRKYQWIIAAMYRSNWWEVPQADVSCTPEELEEAIHGYIGLDLLPLSTNENITVSGWTPSEYEAQYNKLRNKEYSRFHGYAYDGIWTLALAVHNVINKLRAQETPGSSTKVTDFQYRNNTWGRLFREALNETDFTGVTGPVRFFKNERKGQVLIKQFQSRGEVKIGEFDCLEERLDLNKGQPILWREGRAPPKDRSQEVVERTRVNPTMYAAVSVTCIVGICLATVFLAINIRFRNQRYIKMSSPYLNNLIIVGCMLTYTSVILLGMDSGFMSIDHFPYICAARAWVLMSGFTLAFGAMFSKTWRVHAIFTNIKLNKKVIKDYKLFMVVGVFLLLDIIILTTWQVVDPFYREVKRGDAVTSDDDIAVVPEMEYCQSEHMTIFLGIVYGYKGLLMIFGCFLAWETRHVSIPALNDSKYVGMSVYNVVIMCSIGAAISFVLRDHQDAAFIIISVFIIFCSTTTLCLVFVPKLVELRRNPAAGEQRVRATLKPLKKSRRDSDEDTNANRIKQLQDDNMRCRTRLEEKSKELQQLVAQLNQPDPVQIVITNSHHESNAGASKIKPISTRPEVSSPSQSQNNFTSQKATTQEYNPRLEESQAFRSHRQDSVISSSEDTDNLVHHHKSDSRKLSMASLQGSLLVATSILEGAVNACGNVGVSNVGVESVVATGGGGGDVGGGGSSLQATQTLRPLSLISEVQQMMQSQQVCYHSAGGGLGATGRDEFDDDCIDEGHHSPTGHEDRPHSQGCYGVGVICSSQMNYRNRSYGVESVTSASNKVVSNNIIDCGINGVNMSVSRLNPECTCIVGASDHSIDSRVRRRTKSLGALRQGQAQVDTEVEGHTASQADSGTNSGATLRDLTASSQFLPYLFSNQSAVQQQQDGGHHPTNFHHPGSAASGLNHQDRAALFASYPSVKCDIVLNLATKDAG
ncbi:gamma-aminobutyric acid type B receptor subunit 2-like [Varroa jacobsoni]|uniref:gamma-aminobutyric acid type B receptor subunit 2-like n=1 Tax=Varroa jacobsoni TaxID=62625 RepID=UPI000BF3D541|nr:gamma-aminobutyric acid type B receptor subunit 2-like [Varroa jacobsoni]